MDRLDQAATPTRFAELDVIRGVAMIGVVTMNYYGYMLIDGGRTPAADTALLRALNPWVGPLSTRFAATFCMVAGVGITLLAQRERTSGNSRVRRRLAGRGLVLLVGGLWLNTIWRGTILPYYGAMFIVATLLVHLRIRWLLVVAAATAAVAAAVAWWRIDNAIGWLAADDSPRGIVARTFVSGTHPLFPWLALLCVGMALGRVLPWPPRGQLALGAVGVAIVAATYVISEVGRAGSTTAMLVATIPRSRSLNYTVCIVGSSVAACMLISAVARRTASSLVTRSLADAGRMSLTVYVGHALVYNVLARWTDAVAPGGAAAAVTMSVCFWFLALAFASLWLRRFRSGPVEWLYRTIGG